MPRQAVESLQNKSRWADWLQKKKKGNMDERIRGEAAEQVISLPDT